MRKEDMLITALQVLALVCNAITAATTSDKAVAAIAGFFTGLLTATIIFEAFLSLANGEKRD